MLEIGELADLLVESPREPSAGELRRPSSTTRCFNPRIRATFPTGRVAGSDASSISSCATCSATVPAPYTSTAESVRTAGISGAAEVSWAVVETRPLRGPSFERSPAVDTRASRRDR
jgi:hypothetical protein